MEAEFPYLLVVTDLSVFALADEEKAVAEVAVHQTHCQRLAKLFSVDAQALASHIARHRPTAQAINNIRKCSNQSAWQKNSANDQAGTSQTWTRVDVGLLAACGDEVPRLVLQHLRCGPTFQHWRQVGC